MLDFATTYDVLNLVISIATTVLAGRTLGKNEPTFLVGPTAHRNGFLILLRQPNGRCQGAPIVLDLARANVS